MIGNALESDDFAIYAFFSVTIHQRFFPDHSPRNALRMSVIIDGIGLFGAATRVIVIPSATWSENLLAPAIYATIYATLCLLVSGRCAVLLLEATGVQAPH